MFPSNSDNLNRAEYSSVKGVKSVSIWRLNSAWVILFSMAGINGNIKFSLGYPVFNGWYQWED